MTREKYINGLRRSRLALSLAGLGIVFILVLAVLYARNEQVQEQIIASQSLLIDHQQELDQLQKRILLARQRELLVISGADPVEGRFPILNELEQVNEQLQVLSNRIENEELTSRLLLLKENNRRYRDSLEASFDVVEKLGFYDQQGLYAGLRTRERTIADLLERVQNAGLTQAFHGISLDLRDFARTLNMKLADQAKRACEQLADALPGAIANRRVRQQVADALNSYRMDLNLITDELLSLELNTAHNSLQFDRLKPKLAETQIYISQLVAAETERLNQYRANAMIKLSLAACFFMVLLIALAVFELRSANKTLANLQKLSQAMREVGRGNFFVEHQLPDGDDNVGLLTAQFRSMAEQLHQQMDTIKEEQERAQRAGQAKDQFLANMSHEIRTPMNGILGMLDLLEKTQLNTKQKSFLETLRGSGQDLLTILNDILDYSKIEAGRIELKKRAFNPRLTVEDIVHLFLPQAREKGLRLTYHVAASTPHWMLGDQHRIRQVLINMMGNAIKFTREGRIDLSLNCGSIERGAATLIFNVTDTGIGIDQETQERIFRPFVQGDDSNTRRYGGTGLGLSICRMLVRRMGGEIGVESKPDEGSRFHVNLPLPITTEPRNYQHDAPEDLQKQTLSEKDRREIKTLVVEDNAVNRILTLEMLKSLGLPSDTASDGQEALNYLRQNDYDLVFMDIQMPHLDGFETVELMRGSIPEERLPVVVALTANAYDRDREECLARGMDDFMCKPFTLQELEALVNRWLAVIRERPKFHRVPTKLDM